MSLFRTRWYRAFAFIVWPLRLLGFAPVLRRCSWTKSHARVALIWVGWA
ncbi:hypothetical protein J2792_002368 [Novosphingobium capsulatum]|jgi:hypothetical protein|uniref:Uncharacterized protein n=1 Tax=Novosphingobium capsulatum TaxID=13688 RepID=A0ABU1MME1_9SPHN|nr:hypothetical protein [Novosphingobium capsulatum]MDR6511496.1 hypothetical protein [Novosphingobium capsulatum]